ncbi:hypothetical protein [Bacteroides uniformis]|uniref:hypothetical protein n=1 Tax=Bacteroides uniformis TaxID=820 RepID=UPI001898B04A|nr:hypothetical protein [Bacteroides uniformis]MDC1956150.1 hypothetical protein [Bacteroides uniformis]
MGDGERNGVIALSNPFQKAILALTLNPSIEDARDTRSSKNLRRCLNGSSERAKDLQRCEIGSRHAPNGHAAKYSS